MDQRQATQERRERLAAWPPEELRRLLFQMVLIRRFEEKVADGYTRAKVSGFVHLNIGEEASIVGAVSALRDADYLFATYREHGYALAKGVDPKAVMAELYGKETGVSKGRGGSMHLFDAERRFMGGYAIVGGHLPLAVGTALASDYRGTSEVTMCCFGDGTTNIGAFHESLNLARVWHLPCVWVITNNQYGMGTGVARASAVEELWKKALAYDMPGERVDGMDVLACRQAAQRAVRLAREERMPCLLELVTYRFRGHSMTDPGRYRTREEIRQWQERDPIGRFEKQLEEAGLATEADLRRVEEEAERVVEEAAAFADQSPEPDPRGLFNFVYAEG